MGEKFAAAACVAIFLVVFMSLPVFAGSSSDTRNILILHSYHSGYPWTDALNTGISRRLQESGHIMNLSIEYMDAKRFETRSLLFPALKYLYSQKYGQSHFDLIISSDNDALDFVLQYRQGLFPDVPLVFCGVNNFSPDIIAGQKYIGGILEDIDIPGTLNLALELLPDTRSLLVITDNTGAGELHLDRFRKEAPAFSDRLEILETGDWNWADLEKQLEALPEHSIVLALSAHRDREGVTLSEAEISRFMQTNCNVPVFTLWDVKVGPGTLGGLVTGAESHGEKAAAMALDFLENRDRMDSKIGRASCRERV